MRGYERRVKSSGIAIGGSKTIVYLGISRLIRGPSYGGRALRDAG